jgi:hypothetical protein
MVRTTWRCGTGLGSLSLALGRPAPGLLAAGLCSLNMIFAWKFLRESHDMAAQSSTKVGSSNGAVLRVLTHSSEPAPRLIWIHAIGIGAFTGMTAILALFLHARFQINERSIGFVFMYIGAISVVTRQEYLAGWWTRSPEKRKLSAAQAVIASERPGSCSVPSGQERVRCRGCYTLRTNATANSQQPTANSHQPTANTYPPLSRLIN